MQITIIYCHHPFAADRRRFQHGPAALPHYLLISPASRALSSKPAVAAVYRWDRQTDRRVDARPLRRPRSAYYAGMGSASN